MNLLNAIKTVRLFKEKEELIPLYTKWGETLDPNHVLQEYPRPQMKRNDYQILNGIWNYAITNSKEIPSSFQDQILVPFSPESLLSKVHKQLQPHEYLWYECPYPLNRQGDKRCLLHFEAVDQITDVYINHKHVYHHVGGYLPFTIDITDELNRDTNTLYVCVQDLSDTSYHSIGKQRLKRGGMYYTAQSGIWQTVWLEHVPYSYIQDVKIVPNFDKQYIHIKITSNFSTVQKITLQVNNNNPISMQYEGSTIEYCMMIEDIHSWTPEDPYLYTLKVSTVYDEVECYFAMRTYTIEKDSHDIPRICLNHQPIFMHGVLDQGYWSDGLYTAPSDEALIYDIQKMKELGFNMIRKHIKIESARWYYHCDRLGMIVWQDMVNGGSSYHTWFVTWLPSLISWAKKNISDKHPYLLSREDIKGQMEWKKERDETIEYLSCFPCISTWVLFNEGWGQFDTESITLHTRFNDSTRLIDSASGWFDQKCGDFRSEHHYFDEPKMIPDSRAFVLSEYGGYACQIKDHISVHKSYGYQNFENCEDLSKAYYDYLSQTIEPLIKEGLCAAVYTQVSDIEEEVNGLLTYDRKVCKLKEKAK